jgi:hypothetical protein
MIMRDGGVEYQPTPKLTKSFVTDRLRVGWKDLAWAADNHWLGAQSLAELADELASDDDDARVALATVAPDNDEAALKAVLDRQAARDESSEEVVRERWMRLAVAWLYEHRQLFDDPWAVLEQIWEAFGHPASLNGLIRWMPAAPGERLGEEGMLERWRAYAAHAGAQ